MIKKMLKELANDKSTSAIYLHEIALLMEKIETLEGRLRLKEEEVKNLLKYIEAYETEIEEHSKGVNDNE
tara:strand:- start:147 stop:356 length:210 start_codon:yes stop_codon:yes gene_type:complete